MWCEDQKFGGLEDREVEASGRLLAELRKGWVAVWWARASLKTPIVAGPGGRRGVDGTLRTRSENPLKLSAMALYLFPPPRNLGRSMRPPSRAYGVYCQNPGKVTGTGCKITSGSPWPSEVGTEHLRDWP